MWMRVGAVDARMWTWEAVTDFDGVLGRETLRKRFREDFPEPDVVAIPVMRELVCFNSTSGRRHRYIVAFPQGDLAPFRMRFDRVLPASAFLYGVADELMRSEGCGNLRFGALVGGRLYILVFFEGRLCHWSEEPGHDAESAEARVSVFDVFLERDDLYSRAESWLRVFREFDDSHGVEWRKSFCRAARDPFWKDLDLDECGTMKPVARRRLAVIALLSVSFVAVPCFFGCFSAESVAPRELPAPELSLPPVGNSPSARRADFSANSSSARRADFGANSPSARRADFSANSSFARRAAFAGGVAESGRDGGLPQVAARRECVLPPVRISGVVEGRLFLADVDGRNAEFLLGDSVGIYRVASIGRSSVTLVCGDVSREVRNGE